MATAILVRAVFGALVIATVGAFFITQRLKGSSPVVERVRLQSHVSPNGDGRRDTAGLRFDLPEQSDVTVSIVDTANEEVRRLADERALPAGRHRFLWDGRTDEGTMAPEGPYRLRVALPTEARAVISRGSMRLDVTRPAPRIVQVRPKADLTGAPAGAELRFFGPSAAPPLVRVYRTDAGDAPGTALEVARFRLREDARRGTWNGTVDGNKAPDGTYAFALTIRDRAGNVGNFPSRLPPTAEGAPAGTGVAITRLAAAAPLEPVPAGGPARFAVRPLGRGYRWRLLRAGSPRPVARGEDVADSLEVPVPRRARGGLYELRLTAGRASALAPLVVSPTTASRRRPPPLVVVPTITWQGDNPVDDDRDGFPDTLDTSPSVRISRPFAGGRPPRGYRRDVEPLLRFLDRERLRYDLTTDLALARGKGPQLEGRPGVVFSATERWLPEDLLSALRRFVEEGGRVASFGADAFRRKVRVTPTELAEPGQPTPADTFGERTRPLQIAPAPLVVTADRIALFQDTDGFLGLFSEFEESEQLTDAARPLATAERERPALLAYRLGRGMVVRIGARGWSAALADDAEIATVTRSVWTLLSR